MKYSSLSSNKSRAIFPVGAGSQAVPVEGSGGAGDVVVEVAVVALQGHTVLHQADTHQHGPCHQHSETYTI